MEKVGSLASSPNYQGEELVLVRRDFYHEHPNVARRPDFENDRIRTKHCIHVNYHLIN
jgi:hypothetical protein